MFNGAMAPLDGALGHMLENLSPLCFRLSQCLKYGVDAATKTSKMAIQKK
uniref:Uncharacterized protein n=1 Tax=Candidatus Kentrum sp. DK TaxID=2126562 RepID=A0A450TPT7_9GAMM|nr:MAG: hypothetical protein BECKDK2373B_GA0170837_12651 [Candidatus Kentron sp. DK]